MSTCITSCHKCCTFHVCGRHKACFRELSDERRTELIASMQSKRKASRGMPRKTWVDIAKARAAESRMEVGWLFHIEPWGGPDLTYMPCEPHELTDADVDRSLASELRWAERRDRCKTKEDRIRALDSTLAEAGIGNCDDCKKLRGEAV